MHTFCMQIVLYMYRVHYVSVRYPPVLKLLQSNYTCFNPHPEKQDYVYVFLTAYQYTINLLQRVIGPLLQQLQPIRLCCDEVEHVVFDI